MKLISTLLLLFLFSDSFTQSTVFAPLGASWRCNAWATSSSEGSKQYRYTVVKDTLLDGWNARLLQGEIWQNGGFVPAEAMDKYVATIGDKVYYRVDGTFVLIFDFGAQPGDTIHSRVEDLPVVPISCPCPNQPEDFIYIIDSVAIQVVDGIPLRMQYIRYVPDQNWFIGSQYSPVLERVGCVYTETWFGHGPICLLTGTPAKLRCYRDNDIFFKGQIYNEDCDKVAATATADLSPAVIAPNPFTTTISVKLPDGVSGDFEFTLYNSSGSPVKRINLSGNSTSVPTENLPDGLYYWQITEEGKVFSTGKNVKAMSYKL